LLLAPLAQHQAGIHPGAVLALCNGAARLKMQAFAAVRLLLPGMLARGTTLRGVSILIELAPNQSANASSRVNVQNASQEVSRN